MVWASCVLHVHAYLCACYYQLLISPDCISVYLLASLKHLVEEYFTGNICTISLQTFKKNYCVWLCATEKESSRLNIPSNIDVYLWLGESHAAGIPLSLSKSWNFCKLSNKYCRLAM